MTQETMMQELKQIRNVTKNYHALRGLQGVPFGIVSLGFAMFRFGWPPLSEPWVGAITLALLVGLLASLAFSMVIGEYYNSMFGRVQRTKKDKLDSWIEVLGLSMVLLAGIRIDNSLKLPLSATGFAIASCLFLCWWRVSTFRMHILAFAVPIALVSLLPLAGLESANQFFLPNNGGYYLAFGLLLTIGGIIDHFVLTTTLRRTQGAYHDKTV